MAKLPPRKQRKQPPGTKRKPARPREPLVAFDAAIVADLRDLLPAPEFNSLLRRAAETLPETVKDLYQAWKAVDLGETRRQAHKLAGLAGNFGCNGMMSAARGIETACADGHTRPLKRLLRQIDSLLPPTLEALQRLQIDA